MSTTAVSSAASSTTTTTTSSATTFDKNAFLKLLVTQMKYQDPLNPMDSTDFMSQLAQISQVEQLQNISSSLDTMKATAEKANVANWVSSIGKKMNVDTTTLSKGDQIYVTPSADYDKVILTLTNTTDGTSQQVTINKGEALVYTQETDNTVTVSAAAYKNNTPLTCTTSVYRVVQGLDFSNGTPLLVATNGDSYSVDKVKQIKE